MRVKNEAEFLERSINSVIDLVGELVIVNNGSTDGSADVIADFATYNHYRGYVETFWSPYLWHYPSFYEAEPEPLYFHMKFCKTDRFSNMSNDLQIREAAMSGRGEPLSEYLKEQVSRLGL